MNTLDEEEVSSCVEGVEVGVGKEEILSSDQGLRLVGVVLVCAQKMCGCGQAC